MHKILLVSTADTELLAAAASGAAYLTANPARLPASDVAALAARADLVVLRLLGGRRAWPEGLDALAATGIPLVALGGEATPDADLMALSTVPAGVAADAFGYLREGGPDNLRELARFLSDTLFLSGDPFAPPRPMPQHGRHEWPPAPAAGSVPAAAPDPAPANARGSALAPGGPVVAVVFYRAHELSGNTGFV
ncbi:MAG: cobaltochelatase subunit CobN, partial [Streptosporangiaceae bacterium]